MSFVPLRLSQLDFVAEEFWPGGGELGDGRDLYGVAKCEGVWREETTDADLIAEALHPSDADYYDRHRVDEMDDEEYERWLDEDDADEEDNNYLDVLDAQWLAELRAARDTDGDLDGEDGPDTLELVITRQIVIDPWCVVVPRRWNEDGLVPDGSEFNGLVSSCTSEASLALARFERDGVRQQGMSTANAEEFRTKDSRRREWPNIGPDWLADPVTGRYQPNPRWNGRPRFDSWKRHREARYRPRQVCPRITDQAYRDAA